MSLVTGVWRLLSCEGLVCHVSRWSTVVSVLKMIIPLVGFSDTGEPLINAVISGDEAAAEPHAEVLRRLGLASPTVFCMPEAVLAAGPTAAHVPLLRSNPTIVGPFSFSAAGHARAWLDGGTGGCQYALFAQPPGGTTSWKAMVDAAAAEKLPAERLMLLLEVPTLVDTTAVRVLAASVESLAASKGSGCYECCRYALLTPRAGPALSSHMLTIPVRGGGGGGLASQGRKRGCLLRCCPRRPARHRRGPRAGAAAAARSDRCQRSAANHCGRPVQLGRQLDWRSDDRPAAPHEYLHPLDGAAGPSNRLARPRAPTLTHPPVCRLRGRAYPPLPRPASAARPVRCRVRPVRPLRWVRQPTPQEPSPHFVSSSLRFASSLRPLSLGLCRSAAPPLALVSRHTTCSRCVPRCVPGCAGCTPRW